MNTTSLRADCVQCAALCCVAYAFDQSDAFAVDKPAGETCPHLTACNRCTIYAERAMRGFGGCITFDCLGAGQRVTAMFARDWRDDAQTADAMFDALRRMRRVHELLLLLRTTLGLQLSAQDRARCEALLVRLDMAWTRDALFAVSIESAEADVRAYLSTLRAYAPRTA